MTVVVPPYSGDLMAEKGVGRIAVPVVVINPDGGNDSKKMLILMLFQAVIQK